MKIFKWHIDKEQGRFSYAVQKAPRIKTIDYVTLDGQPVHLKPSVVRKGRRFDTKYGRVVPMKLD